ncbi:MAG: hypothetical protein V4549_07405 [Bacteroidota bacterium]
MLQKVLFNGPMDSDSSPEAFKDGMGRFRSDMRIFSSENGESESAEIPRGNSVVTFSLPTGTNTVIGAAEDKKTKKVYYFVHNTSFNHLILEYNSVTGAIAKVFQDSINILGGQTNILNFKTTHLITGIDIVEIDSLNHLLYWTDGYISTSDPNVYNEPRKINIEKGKYFMAGNYTLGYKTPFDPEILFRIKQPADCGPTYAWSGIPAPVFTFSADSVTPLLFTSSDPGGIPKTIPYDQDILDPGNEFDISTFTWTVGTTGGYYIKSTFLINNEGPPADNTCLAYFSVNGVQVYPGLNFSLSSATPVSKTLEVFNQSLTAGDTVKVEFICSTVAIGEADVVILGTLFTSERAISGVGINYLFKLYPVFKTQLVYDDNDVSSWSPWSKYFFPAVVKDVSTGNDIVAQDDTITVTVDTGISIVTKIRVAVKMLGQILNPATNLLQNLEFSLVAELDKANLNIADNSTYSFEFLNDGNYTPLYINESIKLFDSVPLASQSEALIIDGRIVDGLITEGQDPVDIDMIMNLSYPEIADIPGFGSTITPASFLKSGGIYSYGIIYSDHGGRLGTTNIQRGKSTVLLPNGKFGTTLYVPFLTESGYGAPHYTPNTDMSYVPQVNMEIYNRPPSWATHYQVVRSKNKAISKYFQFTAQTIDYVNVLGFSVTPSAATDVNFYINNITGIYLSDNGASSLVYDFTPGDRVRFIANVSGAGPAYNEIGALFSFNDTEIISYNSGTGIIHIKKTSDVPLTLAPGVIFEIYTPAKSVINDNEFMYEIGECFPLDEDIHGNLIHTFSTSNQLINSYTSSATAGTNTTIQLPAGHGLVINDKVKLVGTGYSVYGIVTTANATNAIVSTAGFTVTGTINTGVGTVYKAATGTLTSGDCFRIFQNMPWVVSSVVYRLYMYVENMNISNLWTSNAWDYARPNKVDDAAKRITRQSTVIWSESFIPETFINGLSTVYDTNFQTYEAQYGGIYFLYNEKLWLHIFQELKVSGVPIQQTQFNGTQGEQFVGQSTEVLPRVPKYYEGEYGIGKNPESFAVYGNAKYFIDVNRGAVLRLSNDGITNISKTYNMHNYFTDKCAAVLAFNGRVNVYGVYDVKFGEYIISFQNISDGRGSFAGETLAFNEDENSWSSFFSYLPDFLCSNGLNIISFKSGALYTHNTNAVYANYYGVQYKSKLWFYCNAAPSNVKVYEAMSLEALDAWAATIETPISDENPAGQTTGLLDTNFDLIEGVWYSEILKNDNTPNIVPSPVILPNARFEGDVMRGVYALVKLEYQGTVYSKIFAANVLFIPSDRSNK